MLKRILDLDLLTIDKAFIFPQYAENHVIANDLSISTP